MWTTHFGCRIKIKRSFIYKYKQNISALKPLHALLVTPQIWRKEGPARSVWMLHSHAGLHSSGVICVCSTCSWKPTYICPLPPADGSRRVAGAEKRTFTSVFQEERNSSSPPAARSSIFIPQFQSSHRASGSLNGSRLLPAHVPASHQRRSAETSLCDAFRTPVAPVKLENVTKQETSSYAAKVQHRSFFLPSLLS